ncbi:MAG: hypothetical protein KDB16_11020 [Acidimicrobiales bacterium]|nr:hypothetical protein [Acidimicrobiales bacterium]
MSTDDALDPRSSELLRASQRLLDGLPIDHPLVERLVDGLVYASESIEETDPSFSADISRFDRHVRRRLARARLSRLISGQTGSIAAIADEVRTLIAEAFEARPAIALARDNDVLRTGELDQELADLAGVRTSYGVIRSGSRIVVTLLRRTDHEARLVVLLTSGDADPAVGIASPVDEFTSQAVIPWKDSADDLAVHVLPLDVGEADSAREVNI